MKISRIRFPDFNGQRYYMSHYKFFSSLAMAAKVEIEIVKNDYDGRGFFFEFDGIRAHVDFGDHPTVDKNLGKFPLSFRYHWSEARHKKIKNCFPLTPISFYDWGEYWRLEKSIGYGGHGNQIQNNQIPGARALERRKMVQEMLERRYGRDLDIEITDKVIFWEKVNKCLVSVCVPGARNDILDRGQLQYMAFGCPTISPALDIVLPYWRKPEPDIHYLTCRDDYSDLIKVVDKCHYRRDQLRRIGRNAKKLFQASCAPRQVWSWIEQCVEEAA